MRIFGILALVVVSATASPLSSSTSFGSHVVHESRSNIPHNWEKRNLLNADTILPVRIGLKQQNLHRAEEFINEVAHPSSPNYGKHWTAKQVAETFAPSPDSVNLVKSWLSSAGISPHRIKISQSLSWITFSAPTHEVETLLKTKYYTYKHADGSGHIACEDYSIPTTLINHIDIITPTVHFDRHTGSTRQGKRRDFGAEHHEALELVKRETQDLQKRKGAPLTSFRGKLGSAEDGSNPKQGKGVNNAMASLSTCNTMITPDCLRALYNVPRGKTASENNAIGIVEYTPQAFLQGDLTLFQEQFSTKAAGSSTGSPDVDLIDGASLQTEEESFDFNGESGLDLEYSMALVYPQTATVYQVGDLVASGSFNTFLDAVDGSYCTFEGGDDPSIDPAYPDNSTGGFNGPLNCGGFSATNVISTSYGFNEVDLTPAYEQRQCLEYMKLGLQGVSVLYSSGDYGVAGNGGQCQTANGIVNGASLNNGGEGNFNPSFPGTCPFVTSVGATQILNGSTVRSAESASETVIFSGGGFSNVFSMPSYQKTAVQSYFSNHAPPYTAAQFNNSMTTRGYPDISANGANYVVAIDGEFTLIYGTSASCPTVASMITLINEKRLAAGKSSLGFLNPTLYTKKEMLNDIAIGGNEGCGTAGFTAVEGWDPVTGLGTPNFEKMLKVFMALP